MALDSSQSMLRQEKINSDQIECWKQIFFLRLKLFLLRLKAHCELPFVLEFAAFALHL